MRGLTREDSSLIGFVSCCYVRGVIDTEELNKWAEEIIASTSEYPTYIVDLLEFKEARFHVYKVIGCVGKYGSL